MIKYSTKDLKSIINENNSILEEKTPEEIIDWAANFFPKSLVLTSSMEDLMLIHMASSIAPNIPVIFLDTGYHFVETIGVREASTIYPIKLLNVEPEQTVKEQDAAYGKDLYKSNPDLCCKLRKVIPLQNALEPYQAWITGIRRADSINRENIPILSLDKTETKIKIAPLAKLSQQDIDEYIEKENVIVNPLRMIGYPSIGCAPCTRPVKEGEDPRSGRWSGFSKTECGIH